MPRFFCTLNACWETGAFIAKAFPIDLVLPDDQKDLGEAIMKTRLSNNNFTDDLQKRIERFCEKGSSILNYFSCNSSSVVRNQQGDGIMKYSTYRRYSGICF